MRLNLKIFRVGQNLTQQKLANLLDVSRAYYGFVEAGKQQGSAQFWENLKCVYRLSDEQVNELKEIV